MTVNRSDFQRRFKAEPDSGDRFIGMDVDDGSGDPFVTDLAGLAAGLAPIIATDASAISVLDTAGYYAATNVESALAEGAARWGTRKGNRVIWFGDSLTAASAGTSISGQATSALILDSKGFHNWANVMLDHCLEFVGNAGVGGNTTAQMLARIDEVTSVSSDIVVVLGGTNDSARTAAAVQADLASIYTTLIKAGRLVVACTIPPSTGTITAAETLRTTVNQWMRAYARATPGVILADVATGITDPSIAGFEAISTHLHDGTHPSAIGAAKMGWILANALRPHIITSNNMLTHQGDATNLLSEPIITGSGSSRPSGWTGGGTATFSYQDRTDAVTGKWFKAVCTTGNSQFTQLNTSIGASMAVGQIVQGMIEFEVDSAVAAASPPSLTIQCYNGSTFTTKATDLYWDSGASYGNVAYPYTRGVLQTPPMTIPSGTTLVQFVFGNAEGTYRWGRASLRVVG